MPNMDLQSWQEDTTAYSEVICDAEDTFYHGSEDEDYETPAERRRRYEAAAQRFLNGEQRSILSASLRGPFEPGQGWLNPWRSRQHVRRSKPTAQPAKSNDRRTQEEKLADTQDSFESHLPSPESLKQVEIESHPFLDEEDVDRVQRWQQALHHSTNRNNPMNISPVSENATTQKKRRANGSEWLRQSTPKRPRIDNVGAGSVSTPSRRSRQIPVSRSSAGPMSSFKPFFRNSQLCPGGKEDDDELALDDGPNEAPNSSFVGSARGQTSPIKRTSPKRAVMNGRSLDSAESADELSQETDEHKRAAATLSSPVSVTKKPEVPPPPATGSPVNKLRTPRIRKSRTRHKIEALRAPLPQRQTKKVEDVVSLQPSKLSPEQEPTPGLEVQENESLRPKSRRISEMEKEQYVERSTVRASSPLSSISSSFGSESWQGLSSPENIGTRPMTRDTSIQSTTSLRKAKRQSIEKVDQQRDTIMTDTPAATTTINEQSDDDSDHNSDASSELSDLNIIDVCVRASSVMRLEEQLSPFEKERLDKELDAGDIVSHISEEDQTDSDNDTLGYETAMSKNESRQATPPDGSDTVAGDVQEGDGIIHDKETFNLEPTTEKNLHATVLEDESHEARTPPRFSLSNLGSLFQRFVPRGSNHGTSSQVQMREDCEIETTLSNDDTAEVGEHIGAEEDGSQHVSEASEVPQSTLEAEAAKEPMEHSQTLVTKKVSQLTRGSSEESAHPSGEIADSTMDVDSLDITALDASVQKPQESQATQSLVQAVNIAPSEAAANVTTSDSNETLEATDTEWSQGSNEQTGNSSSVGVDEATNQADAVVQSSFDPVLSGESTLSLPDGHAVRPSTPPQPSTPEQAFQPFAAFMSPSPEHHARQRRIAKIKASIRRIPDIGGSSLSSILKKPWAEPKPKKRVSFAPLPWEQEIDVFSTIPELADKERPASPPPQTAVEDLPTSNEAEFQGHFNAMAKRSMDTPLRGLSTDSPSSTGNQEPHTFPESSLATDNIGNSAENTVAGAPTKSFDPFGSENNPPTKNDDDLDAVFDDLSFMLQPYDLDAELDEAKTDGEMGMDDVSFGAW